ncbi:dynein regulatory complex protein 10-like [Octopus sinensis]|uniref:Dynein regulatory complex protein 10 n=1 Tax=Octopus sinensis TaxID=2607531 RepID=A0A6P7TYP2_9MOLL|nr:dynein regulatory complex protein 10-like [Octopus sinensis]
MASVNDEQNLFKGMNEVKTSLGSFITTESVNSDNTGYQKSVSEIHPSQKETPHEDVPVASKNDNVRAGGATTNIGEHTEEINVTYPHISLQPAKKKLSSLESQRVMNVYIDMVERAVLVGMFPFVLENLHLFEDAFDDHLKACFKNHADLQASYTETRREFLTFCRRMRRSAQPQPKTIDLTAEAEKMKKLSNCDFEGEEEEESTVVMTSEDDTDIHYRHSTSDDVDGTDMYHDGDDEYDASIGKARKKNSYDSHSNWMLKEDEDGDYPLQSLSSSASPYSVDSSVEMRESSDESLRAHELGRQLSNLADRLGNSCKNILRAVNENTTAEKEILSYRDNMSPELQEFVSKLNELKSILRIRLLTTPLEEKEQDEYLKETAEKAVQNKKLIEKLEKELAEVTAAKDEQVKQKTMKIRKLQNDIQQIDKSAVENIRRVKAEADNTIATEMKGSESKTQAVYQELVHAKANLANQTTAHRENEQDLRRRKFKAETEVENWIQKYDQDMGQLQEEIETIEKIYSEEKRQLMELEERFRSLEIEYRKIRREREDTKKWKEETDRRLVRMMRAATTIQAFWRSYKVRKMLKVRKKKGGAGSGKKKKKKKK